MGVHHQAGDLVRVLLLRVQGTRREKLAHILRIVRLLVRLEDGRPRKRLAAQTAPERPLPSMHSTVVLHVMAQLEGLPTKLALKGPIPGVGGQVSNKGGHIRERFTTELAQNDAPWGRRIVQIHRGGRLIRGIRRLAARVHPTGGRRLRNAQRGHAALLAILQRLQAVAQNVPGQFALMRKADAAVHAGVDAGRRAGQPWGVGGVVGPLLQSDSHTSTSCRVCGSGRGGAGKKLTLVSA